MRQRRKPWALPYLEASPLVKIIKNDGLETISTPSSFNLEIGVGKGDFINQLALNHPKAKFIGIEVQPSVLVVAVKKAEANKINNIKFVLGDAKTILDQIKPKTVNKLYINFPDPWPKARHEKRRLLYKTMLEKYAKVLKPNGQIIFKSDQPDLYQYSLVSLVENGYIIVSKSEDYILEKEDYLTEYEAKFRQLGNPIYRIIAQRK